MKTINSIKGELLCRKRHETISDQWKSQVLARMLLKYSIIMVTNAPSEMIEDMYMKWAPSVEVALETDDEILGTKDGKITVIPDGVSVVVRK